MILMGIGALRQSVYLLAEDFFNFFQPTKDKTLRQSEHERHHTSLRLFIGEDSGKVMT